MGWGGGCSVGMGVARWRESYISVMVLDVGAPEYCMLIGASISSKMCAVFCCIFKNILSGLGCFFITGGSRVHFPQASPVPFCDVCNTQSKLQALVYDILSPTSAIIGYAFGLQRLSANRQFFFGAQMAVSLKQTTQITPGVSVLTIHIAYGITKKTTII